jgi:hypothetical protein
MVTKGGVSEGDVARVSRYCSLARKQRPRYSLQRRDQVEGLVL